MNIKTIVAEFAERVSAIVESQAMERARAAVLSAFGSPARRGPGRPPKTAAKVTAGALVARATKTVSKAATRVAAKVAPKKARKKPPRQFCPVPGCKNPAAPIFGMVCAKHKDVAKAKIKQYREARRAKKLGLPAPKARKRRRIVKKAAPRKIVKKAAPRKIVKKVATTVVPATPEAPAPAPAMA